jgi:hypothetical protein
MIYPTKLSLMSTYCIRKILLKHQADANGNQNITESDLDLEGMPIDLYCEKTNFENCINHLETLARMHQVLLAQNMLDTLHNVELQIFNIFELKAQSQNTNQEDE